LLAEKDPDILFYYSTGCLDLFFLNLHNRHIVFHGTHSTFSLGKGDSPYACIGVAFAGSTANVFML